MASPKLAPDDALSLAFGIYMSTITHDRSVPAVKGALTALAKTVAAIAEKASRWSVRANIVVDAAHVPILANVNQSNNDHHIANRHEHINGHNNATTPGQGKDTVVSQCTSLPTSNAQTVSNSNQESMSGYLSSYSFHNQDSVAQTENFAESNSLDGQQCVSSHFAVRPAREVVLIRKTCERDECSATAFAFTAWIDPNEEHSFYLLYSIMGVVAASEALMAQRCVISSPSISQTQLPVLSLTQKLFVVDALYRFFPAHFRQAWKKGRLQWFMRSTVVSSGSSYSHVTLPLSQIDGFSSHEKSNLNNKYKQSSQDTLSMYIPHKLSGGWTPKLVLLSSTRKNQIRIPLPCIIYNDTIFSRSNGLTYNVNEVALCICDAIGCEQLYPTLVGSMCMSGELDVSLLEQMTLSRQQKEYLQALYQGLDLPSEDPFDYELIALSTIEMCGDQRAIVIDVPKTSFHVQDNQSKDPSLTKSKPNKQNNHRHCSETDTSSIEVAKISSNSEFKDISVSLPSKIQELQPEDGVLSLTLDTSDSHANTSIGSNCGLVSKQQMSSLQDKTVCIQTNHYQTHLSKGSHAQQSSHLKSRDSSLYDRTSSTPSSSSSPSLSITFDNSLRPQASTLSTPVESMPHNSNSTSDHQLALSNDSYSNNDNGVRSDGTYSIPTGSVDESLGNLEQPPASSSSSSSPSGENFSPLYSSVSIVSQHEGQQRHQYPSMFCAHGAPPICQCIDGVYCRVLENAPGSPIYKHVDAAVFFFYSTFDNTWNLGPDPRCQNLMDIQVHAFCKPEDVAEHTPGGVISLPWYFVNQQTCRFSVYRPFEMQLVGDDDYAGSQHSLHLIRANNLIRCEEQMQLLVKRPKKPYHRLRKPIKTTKKLTLTNKAGEQWVLPSFWPENVRYTPVLLWSVPNINYTLAAISRQNISQSIEVRPIRDPTHPCYQQLGVFAVTNITENQFLGNYTGLVREPVDTTEYNESKYIVELSGEKYLLDIDAEKVGNEMRFINDYRGINGKKSANAAFDFRFCECGLKSVGIVTLESIRPGEEILLDYGEKYWEAIRCNQAIDDGLIPSTEQPSRDREKAAQSSVGSTVKPQIKRQSPHCERSSNSSCIINYNQTYSANMSVKQDSHVFDLQGTSINRPNDCFILPEESKPNAHVHHQVYSKTTPHMAVKGLSKSSLDNGNVFSQLDRQGDCDHQATGNCILSNSSNGKQQRNWSAIDLEAEQISSMDYQEDADYTNPSEPVIANNVLSKQKDIDNINFTPPSQDGIELPSSKRKYHESGVLRDTDRSLTAEHLDSRSSGIIPVAQKDASLAVISHLKKTACEDSINGSSFFVHTQANLRHSINGANYRLLYSCDGFSKHALYDFLECILSNQGTRYLVAQARNQDGELFLFASIFSSQENPRLSVAADFRQFDINKRLRGFEKIRNTRKEINTMVRADPTAIANFDLGSFSHQHTSKRASNTTAPLHCPKVGSLNGVARQQPSN